MNRLIVPPLPAASRPSNSTTSRPPVLPDPVLQFQQLDLQEPLLHLVLVAVHRSVVRVSLAPGVDRLTAVIEQDRVVVLHVDHGVAAETAEVEARGSAEVGAHASNLEIADNGVVDVQRRRDEQHPVLAETADRTYDLATYAVSPQAHGQHLGLDPFQRTPRFRGEREVAIQPPADPVHRCPRHLRVGRQTRRAAPFQQALHLREPCVVRRVVEVVVVEPLGIWMAEGRAGQIAGVPSKPLSANTRLIWSAPTPKSERARHGTPSAIASSSDVELIVTRPTADRRCLLHRPALDHHQVLRDVFARRDEVGEQLLVGDVLGVGLRLPGSRPNLDDDLEVRMCPRRLDELQEEPDPLRAWTRDQRLCPRR